MTIRQLNARSILSSQGQETVEVWLQTTDAREITASVPAGISAGKYEVAKVPVAVALQQIEMVKEALVGRELTQEEVDEVLGDKQMGGNASLAVSAAAWKAGLNKTAVYEKWPRLFLLLFEGGEHGRESIAMQEFTIIENSVGQAVSDYAKLKSYLDGAGLETKVEDGAEGGFSPVGFDDLRALSTIKEVFPQAQIALDAAGSFNGAGVDYERMVNEFNIASIEDPYSDEDWGAWKDFYAKYKDRILVVGDDLTVTNVQRIEKALNPQVINAVVIKPNQIGTITQAKRASEAAKKAGLKTVVSHRGDETDDDWIVDFALETGADFVKLGGMDRGERVAKYNRLRALGMK